LRGIEAVYGASVAAGDEVPVDVHGDLDALVRFGGSHLSKLNDIGTMGTSTARPRRTNPPWTQPP
jgi:hypothetical protein